MSWAAFETLCLLDRIILWSPFRRFKLMEWTRLSWEWINALIPISYWGTVNLVFDIIKRILRASSITKKLRRHPWNLRGVVEESLEKSPENLMTNSNDFVRNRIERRRQKMSQLIDQGCWRCRQRISIASTGYREASWSSWISSRDEFQYRSNSMRQLESGNTGATPSTQATPRGHRF